MIDIDDSERSIHIGLSMLAGREPVPDVAAAVRRRLAIEGADEPRARSSRPLAAALVLLGLTVLLVIALRPGHRSTSDGDRGGLVWLQDPTGEPPPEFDGPVSPADPRVVHSVDEVEALGDAMSMVYVRCPDPAALAALAGKPNIRRVVIVGVVGAERYAMTTAHFDALGSCAQLQSIGLSMVLQPAAEDLGELQRLPILEEFHWVDAGEFSDDHASALAALPALQRLVVAGDMFLSDRGAVDFVRGARGLQQLALVGETALSAEGYRALASIKGLRALDLGAVSRLHGVDDMRGPRLARLFAPPPGMVGTIGREAVRRPPQHSVVDDSVLEALENAAGLEQLSLRQRPVTDAGLAHLGSLENLRVLDLSECEQISDRGLEQLPSTLRELRLEKCFSVGAAFPERWASLETLTLTESHAVTEALLERLAAAEGLRHLDLSLCPGISAAALPSLLRFRSLEYLALGEHYWIDDEALAGFAQLSGLRHLDLGRSVGTPPSGNPDLVFPAERAAISGDGVAALSRLRQLELLDLSGHAELSAADIARFDNPKLEFLQLRRTGIAFDTALPTIEALRRAVRFNITWWPFRK